MSVGRGPVWALLMVGLAMVAAPLALGMFAKAPQGASMLADFTPLMTAERLAGFDRDLAVIDDAVRELDAAAVGRRSPGYRDFSEQWPAIHGDMTGLMAEVSGNRANYEAVAALPDFRAFPWLFALPGASVAALAAAALVARRARPWLLGVAAVSGAVLIALPIATGMFSKAPQGARMMTAFERIETAENVARIQGYFSTMATGQGSVRLEVLPELARDGATPAEIARRFPAAQRLVDRWVHVLNDMTPMIGAMSDNVDNYQAISSLPAFRLFPWFFVAPGVLLLVLAASIRPRPRGAA